MRKSSCFFVSVALLALSAVMAGGQGLYVSTNDLTLTNGVMQGFAVSSQTFVVSNAGGGEISYTVEALGDTADWLSVSPAGGVLGWTNITVEYNAGLAPSNYAGTLRVASSNGVGATSDVSVGVTVVARPWIGLSTCLLTQTVFKGANPTNQSFTIVNASVDPKAPMAYTCNTNGFNGCIKQLSSYGGVSTGQAGVIQIQYEDMSAATGGIYIASVWIDAVDAGTTYAPTGQVQTSTSVVVQIEIIAPPAPTGVTASAGVYTNRVAVSWDPVDEANGYKVYRTVTFEPAEMELIGTPSAPAFDDVLGSSGVLYYYWVSAVNLYEGEGPVSTNRAPGYRKLAAPGGIFASDGMYTNMVQVTWPLVDGGSGYQLYRRAAGAGGLFSPVYFTTNGSYSDINVEPGVHYEYRVSATNGIFGSDLSVADTGYAFGAPQNLVASSGTYVRKVGLTWTATEGATEYQVWRGSHAILPPGGGAVMLAAVAATGYFDTSVAGGVHYYYWVRAYSPVAGFGGWSAAASGYGADSGVDLRAASLVVLPLQMGAGGAPAVASFRMGNWGGTNMAGANGCVGIEFFASTSIVFRTEDKIGKITTYVTLDAGAETVVSLSSDQLRHMLMPLADGNYYIFVRVLPELPSVLVEINPNDNVVMRNGPVRVRSSGGLNYQVFNDYDGDGVSDLGVYRDTEWRLRSVDGRVLVGSADWHRTGRPVLGDVDGDHVADPMIFDDASGQWHVLFSGNGYWMASGIFGGVGDTALVADYFGVGHGDLSVVNEAKGQWSLLQTEGGLTEWIWKWGESGYRPVTGDYDGDGRWDMAVYQETTGLWYIRTLNGQVLAFGAGLGGPGCDPVPGDYDGDGCWDAAIYEQLTGEWHIVSLDGRVLGWGIQWGGAGLEPVMGDYDGNGKWDLALYQEITGLWYIGSLDGRVLAYGALLGGPGYHPIGN